MHFPQVSTHLLCLLLKSFIKINGKDRSGMDKKILRISTLTMLNNELPDVKIFFEDKGTLYTFNGAYNGCRSISSKLLKLMENDESDTKGADK